MFKTAARVAVVLIIGALAALRGGAEGMTRGLTEGAARGELQGAARGELQVAALAALKACRGVLLNGPDDKVADARCAHHVVISPQKAR